MHPELLEALHATLDALMARLGELQEENAAMGARLAELEPKLPDYTDFCGITGTRKPTFLED